MDISSLYGKKKATKANPHVCPVSFRVAPPTRWVVLQVQADGSVHCRYELRDSEADATLAAQLTAAEFPDLIFEVAEVVVPARGRAVQRPKGRRPHRPAYSKSLLFTKQEGKG